MTPRGSSSNARGCGRYARDIKWARRVAVVGVVAAAIIVGCSDFAADNASDAGAPDGAARDGSGGRVDGAVRDASAGGDAMDAADARDAMPACTPVADSGCEDGGCKTRCPNPFFPDSMKFEVEGAGQELRNLTDCSRWRCNVIFDTDAGPFACERPGVGHVGRVCSSSNPSLCPPQDVNLGLGNDGTCAKSSCTYACQRIAD